MRRALIIFILLFPAMAAADQNSERRYERVENFQGSFLLVWTSSPGATVAVTSSDVARGFVEVNKPLSLVVRSNRRVEYSVAFRNLSSEFDLVSVTVGEETETFWSEGVLGFETYDSGLGGRELTTTVRLRLAPGTGPGVYPWPISVSVKPPLGKSPHWENTMLKVWTDPRGGEPMLSGVFLSALL